MGDGIPEWARQARSVWTNRGAARPGFAEAPTAGQESVWDYPRPPALVRDEREVEVFFEGAHVAHTRRALRLLETSHPPTFYLPRADVDMAHLRGAGGGSRCEWKGDATYYDVVVGDAVAARAAWSYEAPFGEYEPLAGHLAFYASALDCRVDGVRVKPQPGGFYGGWVTAELAGPFKGAPGSSGW